MVHDLLKATVGLDGVELILDLEDRFEITLPADDSADASTVRELSNLIHSTIKRDRPSDENSADEILLIVRQMTAEMLGLKLDNVTPDSRFVQDLGIG